MLQITEQGLYCAAGGFHIDPWKGVERAVITHAHSDHARAGSAAYLCAEPCVGLLRERLGPVNTTSLRYGETVEMNGVRVSLYPAGHVLGSAQVRMEHRGEVWVVSGDYKTQLDPTCAPFEPVRCHAFLTESTFGLPVYRWPQPEEVMADLHAWWRENQREQCTSVVFAYSLGKAQRILASLDESVGPIFVHGAVRALLRHYERAGVRLPEVQHATKDHVRAAGGRGMVIAPPAADNSAWLHSLGDTATAFASGWMLLRGTRRWRAADRGFALSDHADWDGLVSSVRATGAERVLVTHGYAAQFARWLGENGWQAEVVRTQFKGEGQEEMTAERSETASETLVPSGERTEASDRIPNGEVAPDGEEPVRTEED
jgi:putative mRNA 3-end processing factor